MTTTNGGSQGRVTEHVEGIVQGTNERGVHLQGETDWRNFSKYGDRPVPPNRGARVRLGLDGSGFVREVQVLDQPTSVGEPLERSREIRRLTVLKAAANFLGLMSQSREEIRSEHVLVLADKWLAWVEQGTIAVTADDVVERIRKLLRLAEDAGATEAEAAAALERANALLIRHNLTLDRIAASAGGSAAPAGTATCAPR